MNEDQILEMQPGIELDALVAEKVMGETIKRRAELINWPGRYVYEHRFIPLTVEEQDWEDRQPRGEWEIYNLRAYSTDISASWEVVEKMKSLNWWTVVSSEVGRTDGEWTALFFWDPNGESFETRCHSAPEAICKAALLAIF